ncbi:hypothetical protein LQV63_14940 [Paenibacillus profundus]|uniref:Terpene synthase n=1 Tax=Paenibacillus profundus TaxID=1173085 RepID=A0ABS8YJT1_9BACL|nr:hypothetical protein [Paenibacillus profundus]MCE5170610.1 hypothetical protein [Paenibacillus profundus]
MIWFDEHKAELHEVFAEAERRIEAFPAPMNVLGQRYMEKFNPLMQDSTTNYICYLLPYWVQATAGLTREQCRQLSLANVFVMLYFFLQDDLMDTVPEEWGQQLILGNLCYLEFLQIYHQLYPSDSSFWTSFHQYITEWAEAVAKEREEDIFLTHRVMVARKAAPVKFASTGALCLTGRTQLIDTLSNAVDTVLVTLQMADDWEDWEDDLQEGSYNCLMSWIRFELNLPATEPLSPDTVQTAIAVHDCMKGYAEQAQEHHRRLHALNLDIPHLHQFHQFLIDGLVGEANRVQQERETLMLGGLNHWLSKNGKKVVDSTN